MAKRPVIEAKVEKGKCHTPEHDSWEVWEYDEEWVCSYDRLDESRARSYAAAKPGSLIVHIHIPAMDY